MSYYSRFVFPYIMERFSVELHVDEQCRLTLAPAQGEVLGIGFGTGRNFSHYPARVTHVIAVDCEVLSPQQVKRRIAVLPFRSPQYTKMPVMDCPSQTTASILWLRLGRSAPSAMSFRL